MNRFGAPGIRLRLRLRPETSGSSCSRRSSSLKLPSHDLEGHSNPPASSTVLRSVPTRVSRAIYGDTSARCARTGASYSCTLFIVFRLSILSSTMSRRSSAVSPYACDDLVFTLRIYASTHSLRHCCSVPPKVVVNNLALDFHVAADPCSILAVRCRAAS